MPGISNGPNSRPLDDTIAQTGPGIPDEPLAEDELRPEDVGADADRQVERLKRRGWAPDDEAEAHPS